MSPKSPNKDPLNDLLESWRVNASLPTSFQRDVWRRIDTAVTVPKVSMREAVSAWIANALPRPALAATYITALMVIGIGAGWGQARQDSTRLRTELSERYVRVLDPYLATHPEK